MKTVGIILAGGTGERMGGELPKQFLELAGKPVIAHSIEAFDKSVLIDVIIIVCHAEHIDRMADIVKGIKPKKECKIIPGGKTRQESSYNGVKACPEDTEYVLIHDAARPFVTDRIIKDVLEAATETGASMPVIDMDDTVVVAEAGMVTEVPDRNTLKRVQTPQGFKYEVILKAHDRALTDGIKDSSDDCGMVLNISAGVGIVSGDKNNGKITEHMDLHIADGFTKT
ncbi:MAG: 2-C-methyl-D-erythritol 4-phosphate cytidylyltransferase [Candidatus Tantalella remota]|nr:2-C-methyl-D-erythritol 4-phosphate cytidylyltransferase [Candidatus Tantalella remota]